MRITKYFNYEENLEHYQSGSFKIGTLEEYRKSEEALARMSDTKEGVAEDGFGEGDGYIGRMELPNNCIIENNSFSSCGTGVVLSTAFNEHVFCSSFGAYSPLHHEKIRNGEILKDGSKYEGNSDLNAYAEIDLNKFLQALRFWVFSSDDVTSKLSPSELVFGRRVEYRDRMEKRPLPLYSRQNNDLTEERYFRTIFRKPIAFTTENEYRVVLRCSAPMLPKAGCKAIYPQSERLRKSILKIGRMERQF